MSGQCGQNFTFLTLQWHCSTGLTAARENRVTGETPALWRCHGCRPGKGRRGFKGEEENSEQSVTHRRHCPHSKHSHCTELHICGEGARCRNTSETLCESQTFLRWEGWKPPNSTTVLFPGKEKDVPLPAVLYPSCNRNGPPKPSSWNPSHPGAVGVQHNVRKGGVGAQ